MLLQSEKGIALPETLTQKQKELLLIAFESFPDLKGTIVSTYIPNDVYELGGYYEVDTDEDGRAFISINLSEGEADLFRPLLKLRRATVEMNSKLLGIEVDQMTPEILQLFITAHELGHVKDFIVNYKANLELTESEAVAEMMYHRENNLSTLPVPNVYPPDLAKFLSESEGVDIETLRATFPDLNLRKSVVVETARELVDLQEQEYRNTPPERYADEFARDLILNNAERLGIVFKETVPDSI